MTVKTILLSCHLGPKLGHYFFRNKRDFAITVIVVTEFDCITIKQKGLMQGRSKQKVCHGRGKKIAPLPLNLLRLPDNVSIFSLGYLT
jgi:hypothetical protein